MAKLFDGFIVNDWRQHQEDYMNSIGSMKCPLLWMARFQRKIWEIAWIMWEHRNNTLHNDGTTFHQHEMRAIDSEIITELTRGIDNLPPARYSHLFQRTILYHLSQPLHLKQMWLSSVWLARDMHDPNQQERQRCNTATAFFDRWKSNMTR